MKLIIDPQPDLQYAKIKFEYFDNLAFITGKPGTGKTRYIVNSYLHSIETENVAIFYTPNQTAYPYHGYDVKSFKHDFIGPDEQKFIDFIENISGYVSEVSPSYVIIDESEIHDNVRLAFAASLAEKHPSTNFIFVGHKHVRRV